MAEREFYVMATNDKHGHVNGYDVRFDQNHGKQMQLYSHFYIGKGMPWTKALLLANNLRDEMNTNEDILQRSAFTCK